MLRYGIPLSRARFWNASRAAELKKISADAEIVVVSWEALDAYALSTSKPVIVLAHNVISRSLPAILGVPWLGRLAAMLTRRWERKVYSRPNVRAIAVLSRADQQYLAELVPDKPVILMPPGSPPDAPLAATAQVVKAAVLSGSYGWYPKKRSINNFAGLYRSAGLPFPIQTDDDLPADLFSKAAVSPANLEDDQETQYKVRFGIIADDFDAGFKLKSQYLIARNCLVLAFSDISMDFRGLPHASLFIRTVSSVEHIEKAMAEIAGMNKMELITKFRDFKAACQARFAWADSAARLVKELNHVVN
jgi:hypothetical protein